jgi:hypothetical protein
MASVVPLKQPPRRAVVGADLRLDVETLSMEMTLRDNADGVYLLTYVLQDMPEGFDLDLLREAWARWRV